MRLAYISFWSINNGLTQATVLPVVRYLLAEGLAEHIVLFTPEEKETEEAPAIDGMTWHPVHSSQAGFTASGFKLLKTMFGAIGRYLTQHRDEVDMIWARASTAGGCAALLARRFKLPFGVESFEPHADYMVESGAWKRNGLKDRVQRWLEARQIRKAEVLITVSEAYADVIRSRRKQQGKVFCIPCTVDFEVFKRDDKMRELLRSEWGITSDNWVGVYLGKLGDIYYDEPFTQFIKQLMESDRSMHFLFITPQKTQIENRLKTVGLDEKRIRVFTVPHKEVSHYLSAADIAFCPVKESPSKRYCSPIKNGEYWACGLPIIMSSGVGDEAVYVKEEPALGSFVKFGSAEKVDETTLMTLRSTAVDKVRSIGKSKRDMKVNFKVYGNIFDELSRTQ